MVGEPVERFCARALLNADTLSPELVAQTLNLVLKHEADVEKAKAQLHSIATPA